jgi:hypothetical protein
VCLHGERHCAEHCYALLSIFVIMLSAIMLSVILPNVILLNVIATNEECFIKLTTVENEWHKRCFNFGILKTKKFKTETLFLLQHLIVMVVINTTLATIVIKLL